MDRAKDVTVFLLRVVAGFLFIQVGGMKLFGWFGGMPGGATAPPFSEIWFGGVLEVFGGLAIILGVCTRPVAFVLAGEMAVAYFQFHQPKGLFPIQNHGEGAVLFCFIYLFFAAHGAGAWSLDAVMRRRKAA
jgi:putative oxidoreductase